MKNYRYVLKYWVKYCTSDTAQAWILGFAMGAGFLAVAVDLGCK